MLQTIYLYHPYCLWWMNASDSFLLGVMAIAWGVRSAHGQMIEMIGLIHLFSATRHAEQPTSLHLFGERTARNQCLP